MILVSFHGGNGSDAADHDAAHKKPVTPYNNLRAYDDDGNELNRDGQVLQCQPVELLELRGINIVPNGYLWVVSGGMAASTILAYARQGSDPVWKYQGLVIQFSYPSSPLLHPFDFTFDEHPYCYVSNQDTDVVARLEGMAPAFTSASTAAVAPSLQKILHSSFLDGTFVASSVKTLPDPKIAHTTPVAPDPGLCISIGKVKGKPKVLNSVRGVLWINNYLYVADEVAQYVKVYDPDGNYMGKSTCGSTGQPTPFPGQPVHLLYHAESQCLCVSCGKSIFYASIEDAPTTPKFTKVHNLPSALTSVSGMTVSPGGDLYIGDREGLVCWRLCDFTPQTGPQSHVSSWTVTDNPEFLLYVDD